MKWKPLVKSYVEEGTPIGQGRVPTGYRNKGALLVESIDGDFYTVMGLPVAELHRRLKSLWIITLILIRISC